MEDKLLEYADKIFNATSSIIEEYGPDAVDLTLLVVRLEGLKTILAGVVFAVMTSALIKFGLVGKRWAKEDDKDYDTPLIMIPIVSWALATISTVATLFLLIDFWAWVAIFDPKVALAKRAIDTILSTTGVK